ncbi:Amino acid permease [Carpediemonas membranifera]|uniref:Amino acid permease n=1 Tax=Carpediemonas membranifera TaxID=201153 RepID=A0A8J6E2N5_9EUKA|nr:Amino acid permease [Carpediemonas membranifera]|eukprot:KAG9394898.1 Amino acid permease [Carpediemonas membranifera]
MQNSQENIIAEHQSAHDTPVSNASTGSPEDLSEDSSEGITLQIPPRVDSVASVHSLAGDDTDPVTPDEEENFTMAFQPRTDDRTNARTVDSDIRSAIARLAQNDTYSVSLYDDGDARHRINADARASDIPPAEDEIKRPVGARILAHVPLIGKRFRPANKGSKGLGTVSGVLIPCMQNILGVILFLRLSWITGEAGVFGASAIVGLCALTTMLTAISMSAVATNGTVKAGGAYFMISRSLGPEMGAAIGILFYLATVAGCAMYIIGACELMQSMFDVAPQGIGGVRMMAPFFLIAVYLVVLAGVKLVSLVAPVFFVIVLLSIAGIYVGLISLPRSLSEASYPGFLTTTPFSTLAENALPAASLSTFTTLLSVFYPSVTGIMAGANRADSLRNPGRSIPVGTILAITITTIIYLTIVWLMSATISGDTLRDTYQVIDGKRFFPIAQIAWPTNILVQAGIFASTIGAALQSAVGAPRLLQSIAADNVLPVLRPMRHKILGNPIPATLVTALIAFGILMIGNMNAVTPITTMCFIMCYLSVNFSCALQGMIRSPSFRPKFKFWSWKVAMFAVFLCIIIMFLISWYYALIAIGLSVGIYKYVQWTGAKQNWGDGIRGWRMQQARAALHSLDDIAKDVHPNNWRPQLLVLLTLATPERVLTHYKNIDALAAFGRHTLMSGLANQVTVVGDPNRTVHTAQEPTLSPAFDQEQEDVDTAVDEDCPPLVPLHPGLLSLAAQLRKSKGLTVVGAVVEGYPRETLAVRRAVKHHISRIMTASKLRAFVDVISYHTPDRPECELLGAANLVQSCGIGEMRPNCVLTAWPEDWANRASSTGAFRFFRFLSICDSEAKAVILARDIRDAPAPKERADGPIDIFWFLHDGGLLLLLPYLLKKHKTWRRCPLRLFTVAEPGDDIAKLQKSVVDLLATARIQVESITVLELDSHVQEYAYQRTFMMDQRRDLLLQLNQPAVVDADSVLDGASGRQRGQSIMVDNQARVLKTDNAMKINKLIKEQHSVGTASLTILNMPPLRMLSEQNAEDQMEYLDILTDGVGPCLLIKGSGSEVITGYR